jgi:hypothetical protein
MKLTEIVRTLHANVLCGEVTEEIEITSVCAGELMSDVLAFSRPGSLLLTGLIAPQAVRTAEMSDMQAVCFVWGKTPPPETVALAEEAGIPLIRTGLSIFRASGVLFAAGLTESDDQVNAAG